MKRKLIFFKVDQIYRSPVSERFHNRDIMSSPMDNFVSIVIYFQFLLLFSISSLLFPAFFFSFSFPFFIYIFALKYHAFLCLRPLLLLLSFVLVHLLRMLLYNIHFFHHLSEKFINGLKKRFFYETKMAELKGLEILFEIKSSNYDL